MILFIMLQPWFTHFQTVGYCCVALFITCLRVPGPSLNIILIFLEILQNEALLKSFATDLLPKWKGIIWPISNLWVLFMTWVWTMHTISIKTCRHNSKWQRVKAWPLPWWSCDTGCKSEMDQWKTVELVGSMMVDVYLCADDADDVPNRPILWVPVNSSSYKFNECESSLFM